MCPKLESRLWLRSDRPQFLFQISPGFYHTLIALLEMGLSASSQIHLFSSSGALRLLMPPSKVTLKFVFGVVLLFTA